jgi:hypothetical protein
VCIRISGNFKLTTIFIQNHPVNQSQLILIIDEPLISHTNPLKIKLRKLNTKTTGPDAFQDISGHAPEINRDEV